MPSSPDMVAGKLPPAAPTAGQLPAAAPEAGSILCTSAMTPALCSAKTCFSSSMVIVTVGPVLASPAAPACASAAAGAAALAGFIGGRGRRGAPAPGPEGGAAGG